MALPPNPSGLSAPDLRPIVQIDAEKVIASINGAFAAATAPDEAAVLRPTPDTIAGGDDLPIAGVSITPKRTGSAIFVAAVVNGTLDAAGVVRTSLVLNGATVFGSGGRATLGAAGDVSLPVLGHIASGPVGTPMAIEVNAAPTGGNLTVNGAGVDQGVELHAWEVGGT